MADQDADLAMAAAPEADGAVRPQPVFCLLKTELLESLIKFTQGGGRKIDAWTGQHRCAIVPFDRSGDSAHAFANANTLAELQELESL
jgi:molybdopterin-guanine dinucleotide biosynthesis protein A